MITKACLIFSLFLLAGLSEALELPVEKWRPENYEQITAAGKTFQGRTICVRGKKSPFLFSPELSLPEDSYVLLFRMRSSKAGNGKLYYRSKGEVFQEAKVCLFTVRPTKEFLSYYFPLKKCAPLQFRFDSVYQDAAEIAIEGFVLLPRDELPRLEDWRVESADEVRRSEVLLELKTRFAAQKTATYLFTPVLNHEIGNYELCFEMASDTSGRGKLFYRYGSEKFTDGNGVFFPVRAGSGFQSYRLPVPAGKENLTQLRLGPLYADQARIQIRNLRLRKVQRKDGIPVISSRRNFKGVPAVVFAEGKKAPLVLPAKSRHSCSSPKGMINFPSENGKYVLSVSYASNAASVMDLVIHPSDAFRKKMSPISVSLTLPPSQNGRFEKEITLPESSVSFFLNLERIQTESPLKIESLELNPVWLPGGRWSSWRGKWIWLPEPDWKSQQAGFRKRFRLDRRPASAVLQINADDVVAELYVNGKKVPPGPNSETCYSTDLHEIARYLQGGENVIAVRTLDHGGDRGLYCELAVYDPGKPCRLICSDETFKVSPRFPEGWYQNDFDDSEWLPAASQKSFLAPQSVQHEHLGEKRFLAHRDFSTSVQGDLLNVSFSLLPETEQLSLEGVLHGENGEYALPELRLHGKKGAWCRIERQWTLPRGIPDGTYRLKLNFADCIPVGSPMESELRISGRDVKNEFPQCRIFYKNHRVPMISVNGRVEPLLHCWESEMTLKKNIIRNSAASDVHQYWAGIRFVWKASGDYDFSSIDTMCARILKHDPKALILLQIPVGTSLYENKSMKTWNRLHPNELVRDASGSTNLKIFGSKTGESAASWASVLWQEEACRILRSAVEYVRKKPYASHIIGFFPCAGLGHEWVYYGAHNRLYVDYSEPFQKGFRNFLKSQYGNIRTLNAKYGASYGDFHEIALPTPQERDLDSNHSLIHPQTRRKLIDFRRYFSWLTASVLEKLGRCVKEASGGKLLFGSYYGYTVYVETPDWNESGHFELGRLLKSPDIDFLVSIVSYANRIAGGESGAMTAVASFPIHGKGAVIQSDLRTHHAVGASFGVLKNVLESCEVIKRELAWTLVSGAAFEYGYYGRGWIAGDSRLMELVGRGQCLSRELSQMPETPRKQYDRAALIIDEESTFHTIQRSSLQRLFVKDLMRILPHSGFGFDVYLASSLPRIADRYQFFIFANSYHISDARKAFIEKNLKKNGNTLVFLHAPGVSDGEKLDLRRVQDLVSIRMRAREGSVAGIARMEKDAFPRGILFGSGKNRLAPVLETLEGDVAARFTENGIPALTVKKFPAWTSIYSMSPFLTPEIWQGIARASGLWIYNTNTYDSTMAAGNLFAVHTLQGGTREFRTPPGTERVRELFTGCEYPVRNGTFTIETEPLSTWLFLCLGKDQSAI